MHLMMTVFFSAARRLVAVVGFAYAMGGDTKPSLEGLSEKWDDTKRVRRKVTARKELLEWPSPKQVGVMSLEALVSNRDLLQCLIDHWCAQTSKPKTVNVNDLKREALRFFCERCLLDK